MHKSLTPKEKKYAVSCVAGNQVGIEDAKTYDDAR